MNSNYKPLRSRLRATFAAGEVDLPRFERVDRTNLKLHGVQITLEGEALGHGVWLDRGFCEDVVAAGNDMGEAGVKVRFGHPSMCADALGTYLGRATNFRLVEMKRKDGRDCCGVLADIQLDKNADRTEWVLNMAESAPDTFGQSIVFTYADFKYLDAEGVWHLLSEDGADESQAVDGKVYAVLGKLHGTDFTDTPAATDGVFADGELLAADAERLLDENPQIREVLAEHPKNVIEFLTRSGLTQVVDALENARVSGLQKKATAMLAEMEAAKDEKFANAETEWKTSMTALAAERDSLKADLGSLREKIAVLEADLAAAGEISAQQRIDFENLTEKSENLAKDLGAAQSALDAKALELAATKDDLAQVRASLEVETARYRAQVGKALTPAVEPPSAWAQGYREVREARKTRSTKNSKKES